MHIVCSKTINKEIIISDTFIDGFTIYQGHKLAMPDNILPNFLDYKYERGTGKYYFFDYLESKWFTNNNIEESFLKSYNSLLDLFKVKHGNIRNIFIIEV